MRRFLADAHACFNAAIQAADPARAVVNSLHRLPAGEIRAIAVGKAAPAMLVGLKRAIRGRLKRAWLVTHTPLDTPTRAFLGARTSIHLGDHPLPGPRSLRSARAIERALAESRPGETWVLLLSGGASSLIALPHPPLTMRELQALNRALLASGLTIHQMNVVRRRLHALAGGGLLKRFLGNGLLTLALSDVPGDDLATIGSGPAVPDPTSSRRAHRLLKNVKGAPPRALKLLAKASPPASRDPRARAWVVASAKQSLKQAARAARKAGYRVFELGVIQGESKRVARAQMLLASRLVSKHRRICLISGGETTVRVRGPGKGGRNQEFVLAASLAAGASPHLVFAAGTDGRDGPTRAAGAWATRESLERARASGLIPERFLVRNDSHSFFSKAGGLVVTGPTGTNVMDFRAIFMEQPAPARTQPAASERAGSQPSRRPSRAPRR